MLNSVCKRKYNLKVQYSVTTQGYVALMAFASSVDIGISWGQRLRRRAGGYKKDIKEKRVPKSPCNLLPKHVSHVEQLVNGNVKERDRNKLIDIRRR